MPRPIVRTRAEELRLTIAANQRARAHSRNLIVQRQCTARIAAAEGELRILERGPETLTVEEMCEGFHAMSTEDLSAYKRVLLTPANHPEHIKKLNELHLKLVEAELFDRQCLDRLHRIPQPNPMDVEDYLAGPCNGDDPAGWEEA